MTTMTDVTYGQLDKVLRQFGFSCEFVKKTVESRRYDHKKSGALILLPAVSETDHVPEYHIVTVRVTLDNFGIADPTTFAAKLQKTG
jgi:hypothetical protein